MTNKIHSVQIHTYWRKWDSMWVNTLKFLSHLLSSQHLHSNFSILMLSKTFIKLPLQLAPATLPPHQVSNSIPVSQESFAWSHFLWNILSNWSIAMFQAYYHSSFFLNTIMPLPYYLTIWVFITPQYWNFSTFQPSPPRGLLPPFQWDKWLLSCLKAGSALLPPSPNRGSHFPSPSWTWFESYIGTSSPGKW